MNCNDAQQLAVLYLSGELDRVRSAEFQAHLAGCGDCRAGVAGQIELDSRLRGELLAGTPDSSVLERRIRRAIAREPRLRFTSGRRATVAAAAMLLLVLGIVFAVRLRLRPQPIQLCSDAARDHLREIVRQEPRRWTADRSGIEAIAKRVGVPAATIAGFSAPGYQLQRGRLCRLDGRVFLHLVYSSGARRFSIFLAPASGPDSGGIFTTNENGEQVATVRSSRQRAVVVTEESPSAVRDLARIAMSVL